MVAALAYTCSTPKKRLKRDQSGKIIVKQDAQFGYLNKKESLNSIYLPPGYRAELVASEPMVVEPVAIAWDASGAMYVAELRTYMQDIYGNDQDIPISTIKRLEDTNGDGVMDKYTIFVDSLVLPRMIMPLDDRILVSETYTHHIYSYKDTNGDGVADQKEIVFRDDSVSKANLEHQRSGLVWNLDNKIYVSVESRRYNYQNGKLIPELYKERPGGQWGLATDDYGRIFLSSAGAETPALNFQQNPFYGRVDLKDQYNADFKAVWPIVATPDVQGGKMRLRPDSTLNHFTGGGGQSIYRGDKMPELQGDLFIVEPVGRLVRRAKVHHHENGKVTLTNAYNQEEFLASTDMNFRPVNSATGPDGYLYIVDMHRGIIQEAHWTKPDSYLGQQILRHNLDQNIGKGRIYRIVPDRKKTDNTKPGLLDKKPAELVNYLNSPNGWYRTEAQKLMVLKQDKSIQPQLKQLTSSSNHLSRIHSLWTLNGIKALDKATLVTALHDEDARVRKTAVWISDEFLDRDASIMEELEKLKNDPSADVRYQLGLTLRFKEMPMAKDIIAYLLKTYPQDEALIASVQKYEAVRVAKEESERKAKELNEQARQLVSEGANIFNSICATCHGPDGKGVAIGGKDLPAPALSGAKLVNGNPDKLIAILLNGLQGPIDGHVYPDIMPPFGYNNDQYIASIISFIRTDIGNKASIVMPARVSEVRKKTEGRSAFWTEVELNQTFK
ncbi:hypothetical protein BCY91_11055 [Pelobium manganitolerans]|uniref:Cytochrome c domain-containing protein n=2 Tax=Pelobium manganitolerans TaxID=1842495 RepID=A0A419S229_9SPHI|nr:hypothetical protein BCY91_11055 [Pelobium manganitolerans]